MEDSDLPDQPEALPLPPLIPSYKAYQRNSGVGYPMTSTGSNTTMETMLLREFDRLRVSHHSAPHNYTYVRDFGTALYQYHQIKLPADSSSRDHLLDVLGCFVYAWRLGGQQDQVVLGWLKKVKLELGFPVNGRLEEVPPQVPVPPSVILPVDDGRDKRSLDAEI